MSSLSGLKCPLPPTSRSLVSNRILIILMIMMIIVMTIVMVTTMLISSLSWSMTFGIQRKEFALVNCQCTVDNDGDDNTIMLVMTIMKNL